MIVEQKIVGTVKIYYDFQDLMRREGSRVQAYMERRGWKNIGGYCDSAVHNGIEIRACGGFQKEFQSSEELESELQEIRLLFNTTKVV